LTTDICENGGEDGDGMKSRVALVVFHDKYKEGKNEATVFARVRSSVPKVANAIKC